MLGRNTASYRFWKIENERYRNMPESLDFANLGSTCDANNFDYKYWKGVGFNFASAPQDMYYDNQVLEQYGNRLKPDAIVFISISEFAFLTDRYETDYHNHKYYWYLDSTRIINYSDTKNRLIRTAPGLLDSRYIKQEIKELLVNVKGHITTGQNNEASIEMLSKQCMSNWIHEFGWDEEASITDRQRETIKRSWDIFLENIEYCNRRGVTPIIIIPPFAGCLKEMMPNDILEECLWNYINQIKEKGLTVIDFWNSDILNDKRFFRTPIALNESGKRIFNNILKNKVSEVKECSIKSTSKNLWMETTKSFSLMNGIEMPYIAFGTGVIKRFYRNKPMYIKDTLRALLVSLKHRKMVRFFKNDLTIRKTLENAMISGYILFDTGRLYGHSEKYIGEIVNKQNRDNVFIITKVSDVDLTRYPDRKTVHDNLSLSLNYLKTDYVDAYLLHFPSGDWKSMYSDIEKEYESGRTKAIGVCNFDINEMQELISIASINPMICQIEIHPLNSKKDLVSFCHKHGIVVMAHTPTGHMNKEVIEAPEFKAIMDKHKKTAAQIIYRWHHQNGIIPIVSSTSKMHMIGNLEILDFELSEEEMSYIDTLDRGYSLDKNCNKTNDCPNFIYNI